ncbi:cysteine desulfurase [Puteibacter caeruleilacunae]|nr:cysteine desulfurase [Puteibacter caeruleilacunae]
MALDIQTIRKDFPVLDQKVYNKPLVYLDNAATTQRPIQVEEVVSQYYHNGTGNIHRASHFLSDKSTMAFENCRDIIQNFLNAKHREEIIFTKGTTEAINLVAQGFGEVFVGEGDEVIVSEMEHHSNIVPWQLLCDRNNATLKVIPFDDNGVLMVDKLDELITEKTKIISVTYISNVLGTINPVREIIAKAHQHSIPVMIDAAQAVQHTPIDVQELDCDFLAFSGHKIYGPTGTGALYGKKEWLEKMKPYQGGGEMIERVSFKETSFNQLPYKFEAGTPNIIGFIGLAEAIKYVTAIGLEAIAAYEEELLHYATSELLKVDGIRIIGTSPNKSSVISFIHEKAHHYDLGMLLDKLGIAIRTGRHCADPIADHFDISGSARASVSFYNTKEDIDLFIAAMKRVVQMF